MALFLSGSITRACSIGIAGETASGKSTIAYDIINTIQSFADEYCIENVITRLNTDDYYYDRSDMVKKQEVLRNLQNTMTLMYPKHLSWS